MINNNGNTRHDGILDRWIDELALMLPQGESRPPWHVLMTHAQDGFDVYLRDGKGAPRPIGSLKSDGSNAIARKRDQRQLMRLARDPARVALRLSYGDVIEKVINVPREARDVIAPIVQNQIELISPWPLDRALYDWQVTAGKQGRQLGVKVAVAGKATVEERIAMAEQHRLTPGIVDFGDVSDANTTFNFIEARESQPVKGRRLVLLLVAILVAAAIGAGGVGVLQGIEQREALAWASERAELAERRARASQTISGRAARLEARYRLASDEKYRRQPLVGVIEALSRTLPDGTWLSRLEIRQGTLRFSGRSSNAAGLIELLEKSPFFKDVRFAAPIIPADGGQRFVVEAVAAENLNETALLKPVKQNTVGKQPAPLKRESEQ